MRGGSEHIHIPYESQHIPAKIYRERRHNVRFSIGKKHAICRMPLLLLPSQQQKHISEFKQWVVNHFRSNPKLRANFLPRHYQHGDTLQVGDRFYQILFEHSTKKRHHARLEGKNIILELTDDTPQHTQKAIRHMLSRLVAKDFFPEISRRVKELNYQWFQQPIKQINLKFNQSNWGSCSSAGNINLSTRLLFAPQAVIDYVIIHELAHLIEMNHSDRFWAIVARAMPDYKEKEKWLKEQGHLCQF